jgi:hypothetical protein
MSRLGALGLGLCFAGGLQAQTMYKCTGADGKTAFSDLPCPSTAAKQETRIVPSSGDAEADAELGRRYGMAPEQIAAVRARCRAGDRALCRELERMSGSGTTTSEDSARAERRAMERKDALERERPLCRKGEQAACDRVQQLLSEERPSVQPSDEYSRSPRRRR